MNYRLLILVFLFVLGQIEGFAKGRVKPSRLRTDLTEFTDRVWKNGYQSALTLDQYLQDTSAHQVIRIESRLPSFSWILTEDRKDIVQKSYQILVASSMINIQNDKGDMWDSRIVGSNNSHSVIYQGKALVPHRLYFWKVRVKTSKGDFTDYSDHKSFITGTLSESYTTPFYPLQKTRQNPSRITMKSPEYYLADFEKDVFGQLELLLESNTTSDTVTIELGEALLPTGLINSKPGGTIRYAKYMIALQPGTHSYRVHLKPDKRNTGRQAIKMPDYIGEVLPFRYVSIQNYKGKITKMNVIREMVHYPFNDNNASFSSSDTVLNKVWDLCKSTMKATSFAGLYVDGDRERIPYEADALINQLSHYAADSEFTLARRTHEYLITHATWPTEWILQSVLIAWNDYISTGDQRSLEKYYSDLKAKLLIPLERSDGLISTVAMKQDSTLLRSIHFRGPKIVDIVDWPESERDGYVFSEINTVVNAYHYYALHQMSQVAAVLGKQADAEYFSERARLVKNSFQQKLMDPKTGLFTDGENVNHFSLHANMFAMAFDLVPEKRKAQVSQFLLSKGMDCSVYGAQFLLEALYKSGGEDHALSLLTSTGKRSWYNMIDQGATMSMEAWDNVFKPNQDWNHAWGSVPANIITRKLLGIESVKAGFEEMDIRPQIGNLSFVSALVPTIKGNIQIKLENKANQYRMQVTLPGNTRANIYLPLSLLGKRVVVDGKAVRTIRKDKGCYVTTIGSGEHILAVESL